MGASGWTQAGKKGRSVKERDLLVERSLLLFYGCTISGVDSGKRKNKPIRIGNDRDWFIFLHHIVSIT